jgi:hypothetical protein
VLLIIYIFVTGNKGKNYNCNDKKLFYRECIKHDLKINVGQIEDENNITMDLMLIFMRQKRKIQLKQHLN